MANSTSSDFFDFKHKLLGHLIGRKRGSDLIQFRGIPYASIPGRFRQSILANGLPSQPFKATDPGPICPQREQPFWKYWEDALPDDIPRLQAPKADELECLNLSLTIPYRQHEHSKDNPLVPVFVFIHGGGYVGGSHSIQLNGREVFDGARLVRHSMKLNKDIIYVAFNYRLGSLGFLASAQLAEYNKLHNEPVGNYGLHDQRRALDWISQNIAGFGGDPSNITVQGTSAGGSSVDLQRRFRDPKFCRAIIASGTAIGIGPRTLEAQQPIFDATVEATKPNCTKEHALDVILSLDVKQIESPAAVVYPLLDGEWITSKLFEEDLDSPMDIMVGAADFEAELIRLFLTGLEKNPPKAVADLPATFNEIISSSHMLKSPEAFPFDSSAVMSAYGLQKPQELQVSVISQWADLGGDAVFLAPTVYAARSAQRAGGQVWLFHIQSTNPYPASHCNDRAHHGINDLILFDVAPDLVPEEKKADWNGSVRQLQRSWIEFSHGDEPWPRVSSSDVATAKLGPVFVYRGGDESKCHETLEDAIGSELAQRWDSILQACIA